MVSVSVHLENLKPNVKKDQVNFEVEGEHSKQCPSD